MFKDGLTVRDLTLKYLFSTVDKNVTFNCSIKKQDLLRLINENVVEGPSIIFHRCHAKTKTHSEPLKSVQVNPGVGWKYFVFELYHGSHSDRIFYTLS